VQEVAEQAVTSSRILASLGPQFRTEERARAWYAVRIDAEAALANAGFGPESDGTLRQSKLVGRKPLWEIETSAGTFLVRRFSHGGLLRFATGRRFLDASRPFEEIRSAQHLERAGIATPRIVAARARGSAWSGYELDLVTQRVEGSVDLGDVLARARRGEVRRGRIGLLAAALGILVRKLHACGFLHADLTPNNVLVNESALGDADPALVLIDLDRARIVASPSDAERRDNLRRLYRFVARREERDGRSVSRTDFARFFEGYDPGGTQWKSDWRAIESAHARASFAHKIGWALETSIHRAGDAR
jgi:tRNA A-37 threonylcarbamoyl transferase component Bud32